MNIEDIKVGESYNVYGCIGYKNEDEISITFECKPGVYCSIPFAKSHASMYFSPAPTPPKHDPCRPFREGDVVRFMKVNGNNARCRYNGVEIKEGSIGRIVKEEGRNCFWVKFDVHHNWCLDAAYFELITPVEKLEPYSVKETMSHDGWQIVRDGLPPAIYDSQRHPNAKEAAEAECKRLNDEYGKE